MPRPNVLLIVADDHAPAAIGAYGARANRTPHLDSLAADGLRLDACFCTNALCTPARASILTGKYSHATGIKTLADAIDHDAESTLGLWFRAAGYQTALLGKWHLGHGGRADPQGFDYWNVLPDQGAYFDPVTIEMGARRTNRGYVTDFLTDQALAWLARRKDEQPFFLYVGHKAPHDPFEPHPRHRDRYAEPLPEPLTLRDDLRERSRAAASSTARIERMHKARHLPEAAPAELPAAERLAWNYQAYIRNYCRCVDALDENVGRLLAYLDAEGLRDDTIVLYTSDHGFFLGEHGWYDKRFMYEPSLRIPCLVRFPRGIAPAMTSSCMALNVDFAPTLLDWAGLPLPDGLQGRSLRPLAAGQRPVGWRTALYYRYWMHLAHFGIPAHYGIRTERFKLIYYYGRALGCRGAVDRDTEPEWELFDLEQDPHELHNRYGQPAYARVQRDLLARLNALQRELGDTPEH